MNNRSDTQNQSTATTTPTTAATAATTIPATARAASFTTGPPATQPRQHPRQGGPKPQRMHPPMAGNRSSSLDGQQQPLTAHQRLDKHRHNHRPCARNHDPRQPLLSQLFTRRVPAVHRPHQRPGHQPSDASSTHSTMTTQRHA
mmetsp:Transcript_4107/g.7284  ORF Transcript_4107/g.7284 Transcript_4107/m.7284 type:complete len:144 (-) Transcript_4107:378-809(-)